MLDGEELTMEEYHKLFMEDLRQFEAEELLSNSEENNDTTKHSEYSAFYMK